MPITPTLPYPKAAGQTIRAADWNQSVDEIIRLDNDKVNRAGDRITGPLIVDGFLGLGKPSPEFQLDVKSAGIRLSLENNGGGQLVLLNNPKDNKIYVEAISSDGASNASELLFTGRLAEPLPQLTLKAGKTMATGNLQVAQGLYVGPVSSGTSEGSLEVSGPHGQLGMIRRDLAAWPAAPARGDRMLWYNPDGRCSLWSEGDLLTVAKNGDLILTGDLVIPMSVSGSARLTNKLPYDDESAHEANNLKLVLYDLGTTFGETPFEFAIGYTFKRGVGEPSLFHKIWSVNHRGDVFPSTRTFSANQKSDYIVDFFINAAGDTLEQGDVVVIGRNTKIHYYGTNNDIPIPEVDLTDKAYDGRVCGIVAKFVAESDLPGVDAPQMTKRDAKSRKSHPRENSLRKLAARGDQKDHTKVHDKQLGKMATLGAYAYCKVDAGFAPIAAGDLLTTSPSKGHAQKVTDPTKALGAVIGKALAPHKKGKGKIPVLVTLQ